MILAFVSVIGILVGIPYDTATATTTQHDAKVMWRSHTAVNEYDTSYWVPPGEGEILGHMEQYHVRVPEHWDVQIKTEDGYDMLSVTMEQYNDLRDGDLGVLFVTKGRHLGTVYARKFIRDRN